MIPQWVHPIEMRIRLDRTVCLVVADEDKEMEIQEEEDRHNGGDDDEDALGLSEPRLVQPTEGEISVETDEDAHPGGDLRGEVVEKGDDLTRDY